MKKLYPYKIYLSFWLWWIVLTILYLFVIPPIFGPEIDFIVGLFVPFGLWNLSGALQGFFGFFIQQSTLASVFPLPIFLLLLMFTDYFLYKIRLNSPWLKILSNLIILLLVTWFVDYCLWGQWASMCLVTGDCSLRM